MRFLEILEASSAGIAAIHRTSRADPALYPHIQAAAALAPVVDAARSAGPEPAPLPSRGPPTKERLRLYPNHGAEQEANIKAREEHAKAYKAAVADALERAGGHDRLHAATSGLVHADPDQARVLDHLTHHDPVNRGEDEAVRDWRARADREKTVWWGGEEMTPSEVKSHIRDAERENKATDKETAGARIRLKALADLHAEHARAGTLHTQAPLTGILKREEYDGENDTVGALLKTRMSEEADNAQPPEEHARNQRDIAALNRGLARLAATRAAPAGR